MIPYIQTRPNRRIYSRSLEAARIVLVVLELTVSVISFITIMTFGYLLKHFRWRCPLFSQMVVEIVPTEMSNETILLEGHTEWGKKEECWFTLSVSIIITLSSFIWAWLHLHFKRRIHQEGVSHSYVFLSVICEFILFFFSLVSSLKITTGEDVWCENLVRHIPYSNNINCNRDGTYIHSICSNSTNQASNCSCKTASTKLEFINDQHEATIPTANMITRDISGTFSSKLLSSVKHNKSDIVVWDREEKVCTIIEAQFSS
eukprot:XP_014790413.1 PREDICTED: uncharacterized protein LOC106883794 [Octopus bimaculoides]